MDGNATAKLGQALSGDLFPAAREDRSEAAPQRSEDRNEAGRGAKSTIRPPQSSLGGYDWLAATGFGAWGSRFDSLRASLNAAKESAQDRDGVCPLETATGEVLLVHDAGRRLGVYFQWQIEIHGCMVLIADRQAHHDSSPSVYVVIPGLMCLAHGAKEQFAKVAASLESLGFNASEYKPSRVDICVDLPGESPAELIEGVLAKRAICRARKKRLYMDGDALTGIQIGVDDVMCRIYDKAAEVEHDEIKRELMIAMRWEGEECDAATRVEFQIRRDKLVELSINTMDDLWLYEHALCVYLTTSWLRFSSSAVDREGKHQSRADVSDLWERVQRAFAGLFSGEEEIKPRKKTIRVDAVALWKQAFGVIAKAAAVSGYGTQAYRYAQTMLAAGCRELEERTARKLLDVAGMAGVVEGRELSSG